MVAVMDCKPLPMVADYHHAVREHRFDLLHIGSLLVD
jgi:hypothetical protein